MECPEVVVEAPVVRPSKKSTKEVEIKAISPCFDLDILCRHLLKNNVTFVFDPPFSIFLVNIQLFFLNKIVDLYSIGTGCFIWDSEWQSIYIAILSKNLGLI